MEGYVGLSRRRLPVERRGITHKFKIIDPEMGAQRGYVTANPFEGGVEVGELFLQGIGKEGSTLDGMIQFGVVNASIALQYGAELPMLCRKWAHMRFSPHGRVQVKDADGHVDTDWPIPDCHSVPAYVAEWLALRFGTEELQAQLARIRDDLRAQ